MRHKLFLALPAVVALFAALPQSAAAQMSRHSSNTVSVSVTIAPLGPAVDAAGQGAFGLWSISANQGLLLQAPSDLEAGEAGQATIFAQRAEAIVVRGGDGVAFAVKSEGTDRGLQRRTFSLNSGITGGSNQFIISTL